MDAKNTTQMDYEKRILKVLVHIQAHLDDPLDLEELARLASFSPFHFHRIFRGMLGEPVKMHVRRLRLERAADQLKRTDRPVTQIALDAGYEAHESFTRAFRAMFGTSPTDFRSARSYDGPRETTGHLHYSSAGNVVFVGEEALKMDIKIVDRQPMKAAFVRHVGPYTDVGPLWQKFMGWVVSSGNFAMIHKAFALAHDDPDVTASDKLRYDACIPVDDAFEASGEIGVQEVAGGQYAVARHAGTYENLAETYGAIMGQFIPAQNRDPGDGPCIEVYLNNPTDTKPEDLLTDIYVPLGPVRG